MNRQQLLARMADKADLTQKDCDRALSAFIEITMDVVTHGDKLTLVGFGSFEGVETAERLGRNPATGEALTIPAKVRPRFKPGKEFRTQVGGS